MSLWALPVPLLAMTVLAGVCWPEQSDRLMARLKVWWCELTHPRGYPINGYAECPRCQRRVKVEWHG